MVGTTKFYIGLDTLRALMKTKLGINSDPLCTDSDISRLDVFSVLMILLAHVST